MFGRKLRAKYEIQILNPQPGDIVVLKVDDDLSEEESLELKRQFGDLLPDGVVACVLTAGLRIHAVIRNADSLAA